MLMMFNKTTKILLFALICFGLFKPVLSPAASLPGGLPIPSLEDERNTYRGWGWTWTSNKEPNLSADSGYSVGSPDIHNDTEGDDLWSYLMMYRRTSQQGYLDRARAWADYFKNRYRTSAAFNADRDYLLDHMYGWGLVAWYEFTGDAAALTEAENLAAVSEADFTNKVPGQTSMAYYGIRKAARHLLLVTRVAEATGKQRWVTLRDKLIDLWLQSPDWDSRGMYFESAEQTDYALGSGAYSSGIRQDSSFQVGILSEAFYQAYRTTGRTALKDRIIAMAQFVDQYGLDPTYQYTGSRFGLKNGSVWHNYSSNGPTSFWDPVYTTSLVNTLVLAYKYTGNQYYYNRAKYFFNRGTKGVYGSSTQRSSPDNVVDHFVDSRFDSSSGNFYLSYNKGELQYTYLLFENGGLPSTDTTPPSAPKGLKAQ
jgi:hypothetical protein